ncbi:hypothetical protein LLB_0707 [Legionella longbeachae D-4968]|nr:hypothetical protein LLB_0707 [Legionella longbeachae D-4968]
MQKHESSLMFPDICYDTINIGCYFQLGFSHGHGAKKELI